VWARCQAGAPKLSRTASGHKDFKMFRSFSSNKTSLFRPLWLSLILVALLTLASMTSAQHAYSQTANAEVGWTADTGSVTGYTVYYGPSSCQSTGNYPNSVNVGNVTSYTIANLAGPTQYISLRAYNSSNVFSGYASELVVEQVTASAGTGGTISPSGTFFVTEGASQAFTVTPSSGYTVSSVTVDGTSVGAVTSYTLSNIQAGHTVQATFTAQAPTSYTITASAGTGGTITPSGSVSVNSGANQTFTIGANSGYQISSVTVDGASVGAVTTYAFTNVTKTHTISAAFTPTSYTITASAGTGGTITPSGSVSVNSGANQTFTIGANSGYQISSVTVDGASVGAVTTYAFQNVTAVHTISAAFTADVQAQLEADAGPDQTVALGTTVTLNGSNSTDVGGPGIASYLWTQIGGQTVRISNPRSATTTFRANVRTSQTLTFQLTVTDKNGATASDSCIVNVTTGYRSPWAKAGADQTVSEATIVTLDGSESTDPDDAISSYSWRQIDGPSVSLSGEDSPQTTFVAPEVLSGAVSLSFELTVTNHHGLKSRARCFVNVTQEETPPTIFAGPSMTAHAGSTFKLAGTVSASEGDSIASLRWHQMSGSPVTFSDPTLATPTFKLKKVQYDDPLILVLTVKDANGMRTSAIQVVTVK